MGINAAADALLQDYPNANTTTNFLLRTLSPLGSIGERELETRTSPVGELYVYNVRQN